MVIDVFYTVLAPKFKYKRGGGFSLKSRREKNKGRERRKVGGKEGGSPYDKI